MLNKLKKSATILFVLVVSCGIAVNATAKTRPPAPDFVIDDTTRLSSLKGKVVYLDFWASWCGPCRKSFPWMNKINKQFDADKFVVISVNLDSERQAADKFLARYPANFSVTYDPEGAIAEQYKVMGMPSSYLIDPQGRIAATHIGFFQKKAAKYEQQIIQLLKANRGEP